MDSDKKKHRTGAGDVKIVLDGNDYVLRPTVDAAFQLNALKGGLAYLYDSLRVLDLQTISDIIRIGLGPEVAKTFPNLKETVWRAGLTDAKQSCNARCIEYFHIILNGGVPPASTETDAAESPPEGASTPLPS